MADQPCVIGKEITIRGSLSGNEDLVIEGRVEGSIVLGNHLTVDASGVVEADLEVQDLTVNGIVRGDVRSTNTVAINAEATVAGNIRAPRVVIEEGARFKGRIEMEVKLPPGLKD